MSSSSIRTQINQRQKELNQANDELNKAKMDYEEIESFHNTIKSTYSSFLGSIENRRTRLNKITDLLETVKSAQGYRHCANDVLSGKDFYNADENYYNLEESVTKEMRRLDELMLSLTSRINSLKNEISRLEYEYQQAVAREDAERRSRERAERAALNGW